MNNIHKTAIVQRFLSHYRKPIFGLLCRQEDIEYTFFASPVNNYNSVKVIDPQKAAVSVTQSGLRWRFVKNRDWRHFCWQIGVVGMSLSKKYDTIIFEGCVYYLATWFGAVLARLTGKRILMWGHGFLSDEKGIKGWLRKTFYRLAHGHLLYHNRAKEIMIKKGFKPETLYVVYNSLDYDTQIKIRASISEEDKAACRRRLFKNPELPILLFIGRLTPQKKLSMLIDVAKHLKEDGHECNLLFVGDGDEKEPLARQAQEVGLVDNLHFYGPCYDEQENGLLISASDICVAPGEVGLTAMHALVYGTPVITHDDPDSQMPEYEAITPGHNGMFFRKGDAADLAAVIQCWLTENPDKQAIAERCFEVIDKFYNPEYQINVIRKAVQSKR